MIAASLLPSVPEPRPASSSGEIPDAPAPGSIDVGGVRLSCRVDDGIQSKKSSTKRFTLWSLVVVEKSYFTPATQPSLR
jgi:hypothetical protein